MGILSEGEVESGRARVVTGDDIRQWQELKEPAERNLKWDQALDLQQVGGEERKETPYGFPSWHPLWYPL